MRRVLSIALCAVFAFAVLASCSKSIESMSSAELLKLGGKYLDKLDYEQAVVAFKSAIKIDPENAKAYIGLADAYIGLDKPEKAIEWINEGLEEIPDSRVLKDKLEELDPAPNNKPESETGGDLENSPSASNADDANPVPLSDLVSDQYSNEGNYTDGVDNTYQYSYHVPKINIDSAAADEINEEINAYCMNSINEELSNMKSGVSLILIEVKYSAYVYKDVLSIIIEQNLDWDQTFYQVYNVNKNTGKAISNRNLLKEEKVSEKTFLKAAKSCMSEKFKELYSDLNNDSGHYVPLNFYNQYRNTISDNNINLKMPMFVDNNGKINIVATIYSFAGADSYDYIIDTKLGMGDTGNEASEPDNTQVIEVLTSGIKSTITLYTWNDGGWVKEYSCEGYTGKNGLTTNKHEGDGKTPEGKFNITFAFGLTPPETNLQFMTVKPGTVWIDDVHSKYYNTWQSNDTIYEKDWNGGEDLYQDCQSKISAAIVFDFNGTGLDDGTGAGGSAVPGNGSALWLVGRYNVRQGTPGDIDISEADMTSILKLLDFYKSPIIDIKEASAGSDYNG